MNYSSSLSLIILAVFLFCRVSAVETVYKFPIEKDAEVQWGVSTNYGNGTSGAAWSKIMCDTYQSTACLQVYVLNTFVGINFSSIGLAKARNFTNATLTYWALDTSMTGASWNVTQTEYNWTESVISGTVGVPTMYNDIVDQGTIYAMKIAANLTSLVSQALAKNQMYFSIRLNAKPLNDSYYRVHSKETTNRYRVPYFELTVRE